MAVGGGFLLDFLSFHTGWEARKHRSVFQHVGLHWAGGWGELWETEANVLYQNLLGHQLVLINTCAGSFPARSRRAIWWGGARPEAGRCPRTALRRSKCIESKTFISGREGEIALRGSVSFSLTTFHQKVKDQEGGLLLGVVLPDFLFCCSAWEASSGLSTRKSNHWVASFNLKTGSGSFLFLTFWFAYFYFFWPCHPMRRSYFPQIRDQTWPCSGSTES